MLSECPNNIFYAFYQLSQAYSIYSPAHLLLCHIIIFSLFVFGAAAPSGPGPPHSQGV